MNVSCIVNAHREAQVIRPTIVSIRRAVEFGTKCGLSVDVHAVLDRPDDPTREIVDSEMAGLGQVHVVDYADLAESRNHAVRLCESDYLAFIDGDDLWCERWLVDSYLAAERDARRVVFHPEFNVCFGRSSGYVFHHVDMESPGFELEWLSRENYWTALSFARREIYLEHPYRKNTLTDGFGYEDWTWNHETIKAGILHKVVPGTAHFVRQGKAGESLLARTTTMRAIPRVLDMYEPCPTPAAPESRAA